MPAAPSGARLFPPLAQLPESRGFSVPAEEPRKGQGPAGWESSCLSQGCPGEAADGGGRSRTGQPGPGLRLYPCLGCRPGGCEMEWHLTLASFLSALVQADHCSRKAAQPRGSAPQQLPPRSLCGCWGRGLGRVFREQGLCWCVTDAVLCPLFSGSAQRPAAGSGLCRVSTDAGS